MSVCCLFDLRVQSESGFEVMGVGFYWVLCFIILLSEYNCYSHPSAVCLSPGHAAIRNNCLSALDKSDQNNTKM